MASRAKASLIGLWCVFQIDSIACESASMPEDSVMASGCVTVSSGSRIAARGYRRSSESEYLQPFASHNVAVLVTSLPVPAVVGTQKSGGRTASGGSGSSARASSHTARICRPDASAAATAFAESSTDPPPIATTAMPDPRHCSSTGSSAASRCTVGFSAIVSMAATGASQAPAMRGRRPRCTHPCVVTSRKRRPRTKCASVSTACAP